MPRRTLRLASLLWWIFVISSSLCCCCLVESLATIPVWFDSSNHLHRDLLQYHPEQPQRITACIQALSQEPNVQLIDVASDPMSLLLESSMGTTKIQSKPFTAQALQHARKVLLQTHDPEMVTRLEESTVAAKKQRTIQGKNPFGPMGYLDSGDTFLTTESWPVLLRATASWIAAVDTALLTLTQQQQPTFALTRPPAAAALHALSSNRNVQRVSILDWDVHYGQGVADIVSKYPQQIRYASIHQVPAFPYLGQTKQLSPQGNVLTLPMPADTTWTCGYQALWDQALDFCINHDDWQPQLVIICAGYDALSSDELAGCSLNASDFGSMTRALRARLSLTTTALVCGLEGGYQLNDVGPTGNLPRAVVETIRALAED